MNIFQNLGSVDPYTSQQPGNTTYTDFNRNIGPLTVHSTQVEIRSIAEINKEKIEQFWSNGGDRLPIAVLEEFRKSAIPDELTTANVEWIEGKTAIVTMTENAIAAIGGDSQQYATKPVQRLEKKYAFAGDGGWVAYGQTIDGEIGEVAYFKPDHPRPKRDDTDPFNKKKKRIKYETPQTCTGLPLLACVPDAIAATTWQRFGVEPDLAKTYWQNVKDLGVAIVIVEGFKKALSLVAQGIPAIAIRGITMWHKKGSRELHDAIATFATEGRRIFIVFDQDDQPKTVKNVRQQAIYLGQELEKLGTIVRFFHWKQEMGKGIDDVIFNRTIEQPIVDFCIGSEAEKVRIIAKSFFDQHQIPGIGNAVFEAGLAAIKGMLTTIQDLARHNVTVAEWLNTQIQNALTLKQFQRWGIMAQALEALEKLEKLSYSIERETNGEDTEGGYLPELPKMDRGAIHVIDAGLGAGKTVRIGADYISQARATQKFVIVLSPMNSLGQQTGNRWGLPHIHDFSPKVSHLLWTMARKEGGVVMCPDSLHRLPDWIWELDVVLVMDEANQNLPGNHQRRNIGRSPIGYPQNFHPAL